MNDSISNTLIQLFGGMLIALLSIYLHEKIKRNERPEKFQQIIYENKLDFFKKLSLKLFKFMDDIFKYKTGKINDQRLFQSRNELLDCILENRLFVTKNLADALTAIISLEQPRDNRLSEEDFRNVFQSFIDATSVMRNELGFATIDSKFEEIFREIKDFQRKDDQAG